MSYVAIVTGASSGIGEATARRLAADPDVHVIAVARRRERLPVHPQITPLVADLTDPEAPARIASRVGSEHGALHLLVNNAGARWSADFGAGGWANVERHMRMNFEAQVRLTEALLPILGRTAAGAGLGLGTSVPTGHPARGPVVPGGPTGRPTVAGVPLRAPVAIVNVSSTAGRVARRGTGGYNASKFALIGWSDSLHLEQRDHGVHVGLVLPGFVATEGFPQTELRASPLLRALVTDVGVVVEAILEAGPGARAERYAPRYYRLFAALRIIAPGLVRAVMSRDELATSTYSN